MTATVQLERLSEYAAHRERIAEQDADRAREAAAQERDQRVELAALKFAAARLRAAENKTDRAYRPRHKLRRKPWRITQWLCRSRKELS